MFEKAKSDAIKTLKEEKERIAMWTADQDVKKRCDALDLAITALEMVDATALMLVHTGVEPADIIAKEPGEEEK